MSAILVAWQVAPSLYPILARVAAQVTTVGDADLWVVVENAAGQEEATARMAAAGANRDRLRFLHHRLDSPWVRDYGPHPIYEGDCRALVGHTYDFFRPHDFRPGASLGRDLEATPPRDPSLPQRRELPGFRRG